MKLSIGQLVITRNALDTLSQDDVLNCVSRHINGDWGDVPTEDSQHNDWSLEHGERILSSYEMPSGKFWVITEWDRSYTTVMLPGDY